MKDNKDHKESKVCHDVARLVIRTKTGEDLVEVASDHPTYLAIKDLYGQSHAFSLDAKLLLRRSNEPPWEDDTNNYVDTLIRSFMLNYNLD
ncbi:MAG: hypothetical protein VXY77_02215 [Pseudomonadota bacterium]|nr:hypothetical protein [Pseudomonadota bacterium]